MSAMIEVNNLVKRYQKSHDLAVDHVSFLVEEGEFFAFLGPNGAGKTTTVSILSTTLTKTSGLINVAGYNLDQSPSSVRQSIGIIFQSPSLDENLTAEENIRFHAVLYNLYPFRPSYSWMPQEYQDRVMGLAKVLDIEKDIFKPVKSFSGGMKRKLEIVRSLMHDPEILFLDEPTVGLDPVSRKNLWSYLQDVRNNRHTTIFLTTHYLEEAETADRIAIINRGKIISYGSPRQIKQDLIEEYLLVDADDRESLRQELEAQGLEFTQEPEFKVHLNSRSPQEIIKSINTKLSLLRVHSPTLEEAYLEIIGRAENNSQSPHNDE